MGGEFVVEPQEWGWSIAVRETGEVIFFDDADAAERSAHAMALIARQLGASGTVIIKTNAPRQKCEFHSL